MPASVKRKGGGSSVVQVKQLPLVHLLSRSQIFKPSTGRSMLLVRPVCVRLVVSICWIGGPDILPLNQAKQTDK